MRRMAACLAAAPVMGTTAGRATVGTSTMSQPGLSSGSGTNGGAHVGGVWGEAILRLGSTTIIQCPVFILPISPELSILCLMKNCIYQGKYCLVHCCTRGLVYSWPCVAHHLCICVFFRGNCHKRCCRRWSGYIVQAWGGLWCCDWWDAN